jgi:hypothetical protein
VTDAPDPAALTEDMVMDKWAKIAPLIEIMTARIQNPEDPDWAVKPGSELADDDDASNPYQVSHCARACLNAGVNHLHALKSLIFGAPILHGAADYSLIRGALENFAAAFWVLHPLDRSDRIEHALRWMVKNFKDQDKATAELNLPNYVPLDANLDKVVAVGEQAACEHQDILRGYYSTTVLKYAEQHSSANPYLMWQVCSGFAHGRQWANIAMSALKIGPTTEDGLVTVSFTTDYTRLLAATLPAFDLMTDVVRLLTDRAAAR